MIDIIKPLIKQFLPFAQERMGFQDPPRLFIREDEENAQNALGKTAFYDPGAKSVTLYVTGRHPKDVMRSLSHELVHHAQNCNGQFDNVGQMGDGYAQNDAHLREMERQAYEIGNLCFRDWEDSIKHTIYNEHLQKGVEKIMSTKDWKNGEINTLLTEKWGFSFELDRLDEKTGDDLKNENCAASDIDGGEVVVMGDEEVSEPEDPNAIVDELGDLVARLSAVLGGGDIDHGEEMVVDVQERLRKSLKSILETGSMRKGESKSDKGKDEDDPEARDYEHGGDRKGDKSETHPGRDFQDTRHHHPPTHEDSEEEHYEENAMSDEDHIKAIRHHLKALESDKDYDEEKDEELEERRGRGRKGPHIRGAPDPRLREAIRKALRAVIANKK